MNSITKHGYKGEFKEINYTIQIKKAAYYVKLKPLR